MQESHLVGGSTEYRKVLKRIGQARKSQSCLLLTSREAPEELAHLAGKTMQARTMMLPGLSKLEGEAILKDKGLASNDD
jgi:hypothetical protein